jgi:hypothetical protein
MFFEGELLVELLQPGLPWEVTPNIVPILMKLD